MDATKPKRGRPGRKSTEGARVPLGLRVTPELKEKLDAAARQSGRSQSQEAELRLEHSFRDERVLESAQDRIYGTQLSGLLMLIAKAMRDIGASCGKYKDGKLEFTLNSIENWLSNPYAFDQVVKGVNAIFEAIRPEGEAIAPTLSDPVLTAAYADAGRAYTRPILGAVRDPAVGGDLGQWAEPVRARLGPVAARIHIPSGGPAMVAQFTYRASDGH